MKIGIVTGFTHNIINDFIHFYNSLRNYSSIPLYVVPYDFNNSQLEKLENNDMHIINIDTSFYDTFKIDNRWSQWCKPSVIKYVRDTNNIDCLLWLDIDIVVTQDLSGLFSYIIDKFLIVEDFFAPMSCLNDKRLYDVFPNPDNDERAVNTGVVGFMFPRDNCILDAWCDKVKLILDNPSIRDYISLYDQGCLIWALSDMKYNHLISSKIEYNYPAVKKLYDMNDLYLRIKSDNPGVVIAHYAGAPKLSQLLSFNDNVCRRYVNGRYDKIFRLVCVGLETSDLFKFSTILDCHSRRPSCISYSDGSNLDMEISLKIGGYNYYTENFMKIIGNLSRNDGVLICQCNHNLSYFMDDLINGIDDIKFLVILKHPIDIIRDQLLSFCVWDELIHLYDINYQLDYYNSVDVKKIRKNIPIVSNNIIDIYIYDIENTIIRIMNQLSSIDDNRYLIMWSDSIHSNFGSLEKLIGNSVIWSKVKTDISIKSQHNFSKSSIEWINGIIESKRDHIINNFIKVVNDYNLRII